MLIYACVLADILELRYYYRYRSLIVLFVSSPCVLHACIIVVDEGSVYCKYISSFAVLLFLVLKIRSYLKILSEKSECGSFINNFFRKKHLQYMEQICYGLLFWHHICKIRREMARTGAQCSQLKCMPS